MTVYEILADAIRNKKQILATYQGYYREMCPHALGTKNGRRQCLFLQFGGTSKSGLSSNPELNWRCIPIEQLTNVSSRTGQWHTAGNHSRANSCIDRVEVVVSF
jgi:hypothetical protein